MNKRWRLLVAISAVLAMSGIGLWFGVFRDRQQPVIPNPPVPQKPLAELLVGTWKKVQPGENPDTPALFEVVVHYGNDGKYEYRVWNSIEGYKTISGTYRLDGHSIQFLSPVVNPSPIPRQESWELVNTIEFLTERDLVIGTVTKKRWAPEIAQELAEARGVPLATVLGEVREERSRSVYVRIKDE